MEKDYEKEWFPTPKKVANIMKKYITWSDVTTILEPSAGKGDLIKHLFYYQPHRQSQWRQSYHNKIIYAIESNVEFQILLRDGGLCNVIDTDFLEYRGSFHFDLIVMNPPFSNGDEHLLKAWEIMRKGQILCLLNKETYSNPYSKKRELLKRIIDEHGEIIELGTPFSVGKKKTNVEVVLVVLKKDEKDEFTLDIDATNITQNTDKLNLDISDVTGSVALKDEIQTRVSLFNEKINRYKETLISIKRFEYFGGSPALFGVSDFYESFNKYIEATLIEEWNTIFESGVFKNLMTEKVRDKFHDFTVQQQKMDFTVNNIDALISTLMLSKNSIMESSIIEVFDYLTRYHETNIVYVEGWKTNDAFAVKEKIILPRIVSIMFGYSLDYYAEKRLDDIDRVMCYISGHRFSKTNEYTMSYYEGTISHTLKKYFKLQRDNPLFFKDKTTESHFFRLKFYKKGTLHLEFKDKKLWQEFNIRVARYHNWLPKDYRPGKKDIVVMTNKPKEGDK